MSRRILSVIMSVVLLVGLMPLPSFAGDALVAGTSANTEASTLAYDNTTAAVNAPIDRAFPQEADLQTQADASAVNAHIPKNVKVKFTGTETDSEGNKYLLAEVSWDADENVSLNELYPLVADASDGLYLIPSKTGQTVGNAASGAPEDVRFTTKDGRSSYTMKLRILKEGEQQFAEDEHGKYANGLKENDTGVFLMTGVVSTGSGAAETDYSKPVEFVYTEENVKNKKTFVSEGEDPSAPKNVALAKMVTSDGKTTASQTVSWPKTQASISFRPGSLEGYTVSPTEHVFTKDGEIFTFTYTPTQSVEAVTDVTVTVNYLAPAGYQAPASKKATGQPGANYQIDTPEVKGLFPSQRTVAGQFGTTNQTITVSYGGMEMIDDHVVAVPAGNVFTYNGHFQEGVPKHAGYRIVGINHARVPSVNSVILYLNSGYRWSDGGTDPKVVTWAINPAPLSSMVLDRTRFDTAQDLEQKPNVVAVIANGVVVPQGAYSVTYSNPTAEQPGIYSVTVKATDSSFTGTLTETYGITQTLALACPHHGEKVNYMSNGDGATHDEECAYCNKVLVGKDHQACTFDKVGAKVVDNIDPSNQNSGKPTGQVFLVCSKCNQGKSEFETCLHEGTRAFRDNGDGTHTEYCTRCGLDLFSEAHEMVDEAVKTPVGNGHGQTVVAYQGTYAHKCSKCSYQELKECPHEKTHVVRIGGGDYEQHDLYCDLCKAFVERVKCSNFTRTCMNSGTHSKTCAECGSVHGYFGHDWQRQITKVDAIPRACKTSAWLNPNKLFFTYYDYRIHYTETCKQCKAKRVGAYLYKTSDINGSFNYKKAFQSLVNMSSEDLKNVHSIWSGDGSYLLPAVGNALVEPLMSTLQPVTALVGWDSVEYASLDFTQLVNWEGSTESPGDGYKLYTPDGKLVESAKVPGDVPNPAWSVEGGSGAQAQGLQAQGVFPEPVDGADTVPDLDGATEVYVTVGANVLNKLSDGTHTLAVCGLLENGERACSVMEFTIETVETDDGKRKAIKALHPLGASVDAEGDVVSVQLPTDTVAYTGNPVELPTVSVAKSQEGAEGGMAPLPQDAYALTYYRINDVEGEPDAADQVQVNPAEIVDPGSYCVVATPAGENPGWSGTAFANFRVARTFESSNATMELEFDHATYTGAEIEPKVTVKAIVDGEERALAQSYAYTATDEQEGDETVTTLTQGGAGDYTVQYQNNVEEGTATVTVTGDGIWAGTLTRTFKIEAAPAPDNALTEMTLSQTSFTYNGKAQRPSVASVKAGDAEVEAADYAIEFSKADSVAAGTYQVTVTAEAWSDFEGSVSAEYKINPAAITSVTLSKTSVAYTGAAQATAVKDVKAGSLALKASDYTVSYQDAKGKAVKASAIKNAGKYTVTVTGKGNFIGSKSATFTVNKTKPKLTTALKKTYKASKVKAKAQSFAAVKLTTDGKVTYAVATKDPKKVLSLNKKTGKVTVKKGAKKGTYKMKVKVSAKAGKNYSAFKAKTYAVQVTVK